MLERVFAVVGSLFTAAAIIVLWSATGQLFGYSDTWQLVVNTATTIVKFLMGFLLQNSQNRDAAAVQAKPDELIRAVDAARSQFIGIEHLTESEIEKIRSDLERECAEIERIPSADISLQHLKKRL